MSNERRATMTAAALAFVALTTGACSLLVDWHSLHQDGTDGSSTDGQGAGGVSALAGSGGYVGLSVAGTPEAASHCVYVDQCPTDDGVNNVCVGVSPPGGAAGGAPTPVGSGGAPSTPRQVDGFWYYPVYRFREKRGDGTPYSTDVYTNDPSAIAMAFNQGDLFYGSTFYAARNSAGTQADALTQTTCGAANAGPLQPVFRGDDSLSHNHYYTNDCGEIAGDINKKTVDAVTAAFYIKRNDCDPARTIPLYCFERMGFHTFTTDRAEGCGLCDASWNNAATKLFVTPN